MCRTLKNIAIVSLILMVLYLACIFIFSQGFIRNRIPNLKNLTGQGFCLQRFRDINNFKATNLLFLGPSHVYRGFDTRIFEEKNISCFNMGSSNQSPLNSYFLLKDYLGKIKPQKIILEISFESLEIDGNESSIDLVSNLPFSFEMVKMVLNSKNDLISFNSMISIYINRIFHPLSLEVQGKISGDNYVEGGYVEFTNPSNYKDIIQNSAIRTKSSKPEKKQITYLEKIIVLAKEKNISLALVSTPILPLYKNCILNYNEIRTMIQVIAKKHNLTYIDFNDDEHFKTSGLIPEKHFYDHTHLNSEGVRMFNKYFITLLNRKIF